MHLLDLEAIRLVLPLLYFFCPSGLDDVSRPIQELALSPYIVNEAQRGVIYGITSYASVPPVKTVFRALFPTAGPDSASAEDVFVTDPPNLEPKYEHPYKPPHVTSFLQAAPKPPVQPTCSRLDALDLVNVSRVFQDPTITRDPVLYSPTVGPLASAVILAFTTAFVLLLFRESISLVFDFYSGKVSAPPIIYWFKLFLGVVSCAILGNYQLSMDAKSQAVLAALVAGYVLGDADIPGIIRIIGRIILSTIAPTGWNRGRFLSKATTTIPTTSSEPKFNIGIQTVATEMETIKEMGTQPDRVMADVGTQTKLVSASSPALQLDSEVQTDIIPGLILNSPPPADYLANLDVPTGRLILSPATPTMVDDDILMEMTTKATPILVLPLTVSTTDSDEQIEAVIDVQTRTNHPMESTLIFGPVPIMAQVDGTDNTALRTATTDNPMELTPVTTVDVDLRINEPVSTLANEATINDEIPTDIISKSTLSSIPEPFPRTVALHLTSQVAVAEGSAAHAHALKETVDEGKTDERTQTADTPAPAPLPILGLVTLRNPERSAVPQPAAGLRSAPVSTPTRHVVLAQAPSRFASQHPPPFRPPGLGYQPSRQIMAGPDPCVQQPVASLALRPAVSEKQPIRPRFPSTTTQYQQLIAPPPDRPTGLDNHTLHDGPHCGNSHRLPGPVRPGPNHMADPLHQQVATPRPFMLPTRDFTVQDPFSRSLTPTPPPVGSGLNSASEPSSAALRFIPRRVVPVPAGSPALAARQVLRRFQPLPIPIPEPVAPPPTSAPSADVRPLLKNAPSFWAPPRENSALPVVPPCKKPRVRTRVRSRRMTRDTEIDESEDGHVGVAIATSVLDGANDSIQPEFRFRVPS